MHSADKARQLARIGENFDRLRGDREIIRFLASLAISILAERAVDFEDLTRFVDDHQGGARFRAVLIVIAAFMEDPRVIGFLRRAALEPDELVSAVAVLCAIVHSAPPLGAAASLGQWESLWNGVLLDPHLDGQLDPGYLSRLTQSGQINGEALPPSPWWERRLKGQDSDTLALLRDVALGGSASAPRIIAIQEFPHGLERDALIERVLDDQQAPNLVRAVAYEHLEATPSNWQRLAVGLRQETDPRVLAGIAATIIMDAGGEKRAETARLLEAIIPVAAHDAQLADRALTSLSLMDTPEGLSVLSRVAQTGETVDLRLQAVSAISYCSVDTAIRGERLAALRQLVDGPDLQVAAYAAGGLISSSPSVVTDQEFMDKARALATSPGLSSVARMKLQTALSELNTPKGN